MSNLANQKNSSKRFTIDGPTFKLKKVNGEWKLGCINKFTKVIWVSKINYLHIKCWDVKFIWSKKWSKSTYYNRLTNFQTLKSEKRVKIRVPQWIQKNYCNNNKKISGSYNLKMLNLANQKNRLKVLRSMDQLSSSEKWKGSET